MKHNNRKTIKINIDGNKTPNNEPLEEPKQEVVVVNGKKFVRTKNQTPEPVAPVISQNQRSLFEQVVGLYGKKDKLRIDTMILRAFHLEEETLKTLIKLEEICIDNETVAPQTGFVTYYITLLDKA